MKKKIILLQDNTEALERLTADFCNDENFEVIGTYTDGIKGFNALLESKADIVILDLILTGLDGISFLERVKETGLNTKCIVLTSFMREELITLAMNRGAVYYMVRPVEAGVLKKRLLSEPEQAVGDGKIFFPKEKQKSLEEKVSNIFINVGIPPHIKGYNYLREGVIMTVNDPNLINNITKKLYPSIGEKYATTASKVERAIRHAIEVAWNRGRIEMINSLFGVKAYIGSEKPTNGEFIALIADKMLLEMA